MKKKNNKGFTLIEAIAAVTIMLLITLIAIPTSKHYIDRGKNQQCQILKDQIISAGSKYYINHKNDTSISIEELKNANLLNEIDDKFIDSNKIINPKTNTELTEQINVTVDGSGKVTYNLDICS